MTPRDLRNIHTTGNSCRDAFPCANMALKLPQYFYLLMEKPVGHYFRVRSLIIFNLHFNLNRFLLHSYLLLNMWLTCHCTKSLTDRLHIQERLYVSLLTNFCKGVCLFKSWFILGSTVLLFYDITKFIKILLRLS